MTEHNHRTRVIKAEGQCPACDAYHRKLRKQRRALERLTAMETQPPDADEAQLIEQMLEDT